MFLASQVMGLQWQAAMTALKLKVTILLMVIYVTKYSKEQAKEKFTWVSYFFLISGSQMFLKKHNDLGSLYTETMKLTWPPLSKTQTDSHCFIISW